MLIDIATLVPSKALVLEGEGVKESIGKEERKEKKERRLHLVDDGVEVPVLDPSEAANEYAGLMDASRAHDHDRMVL